MNAPFLLLLSVILSYLIKGRLFFFRNFRTASGAQDIQSFIVLFLCVYCTTHRSCFL